MFTVASLSHAGVKRDANEDAVAVDSSVSVYVVADGVGGSSAGEVASRMASDEIVDRVTSGYSLSESCGYAHEAVVSASRSDEKLKGMSTTVVALRIADSSAEFVWVGDSRGYLFRDDQLIQLTWDHTVSEMLRRERILEAEDAKAHPKGRKVTRVLGGDDPTSERRVVRLKQSDLLLLCSDGLTDELDDHDICRHVSGTDSIGDAAQSLVDAACRNGGRDNVSVVLVEFDGDSHEVWDEIDDLAANDGMFASESSEVSQQPKVAADQVMLPIALGAFAAFVFFCLFVFLVL